MQITVKNAIAFYDDLTLGPHPLVSSQADAKRVLTGLKKVAHQYIGNIMELTLRQKPLETQPAKTYLFSVHLELDTNLICMHYLGFKWI